MRWLFLAAAALLCLGCASHRGAGPSESSAVRLPDSLRLQRGGAGERYAPHTLIVYYDADSCGAEPLLNAAGEMKCKVLYRYSIIPAVAVSTPDDMDLEEAIRRFSQVKGVLQVCRDQIYQIQ